MTEIPKGFLVFKTMSKQYTESLLNEPDPLLRKEQLESLIPSPYSHPTSDIFHSFHFNNLSFCISKQFSPEKTSCLLEIFEYLFSYSFTNRLPETKSFEIFKKLLLKHSVQRSPYSIAVFSCPEVKQITDFALITFFRHYPIYEYIFTPNCNLALKNVNRFEGNFPVVLRLDDGVEISAESIPALDEFIIKPVIEEPPRELDSEEEEALITDPLQYLLDKEMKLIKLELEEKIRKQDEEFFSKMDVFKR